MPGFGSRRCAADTGRSVITAESRLGGVETVLSFRPSPKLQKMKALRRPPSPGGPLTRPLVVFFQGPHQRPGGHQTALHVWEEYWRLCGKWGLSFCWHGSLSLCGAPQQGTPGTGTAFLTTDLSLKRIISILPKMDGNLLHELLAASERGAGSPCRSHVLHADLLLGLS